MTKYPGCPRRHYPAYINDLHELPSVTDFEDALSVWPFDDMSPE